MSEFVTLEPGQRLLGMNANLPEGYRIVGRLNLVEPAIEPLHEMEWEQLRDLAVADPERVRKFLAPKPYCQTCGHNHPEDNRHEDNNEGQRGGRLV